ncbi:MAG: type I-E CRISPR-associated protein Cse2/CasB [Desulfobulbaceae bacterium]|nr:type I-E CRISPR-associated protein Cse2/CasB [Desulfobulbaceae bacterium]
MSWFFEQLRKRKDDRGMMASLRCILVDTKKHRASPALHRLGIAINDEVSTYVAGLYATHPEETGKGNFGNTCNKIQSERNERQSDDGKITPTERRFQHLLAAEENELPDRVLRMVLMAKAHAIPVNYEQLTVDIKYWNDKTKNKWASAFWTQETAHMEEQEK